MLSVLRPGAAQPTPPGNSQFIPMFLWYHFLQLLLLARIFVVTTAMTSDGAKRTFSPAWCFLGCTRGDARDL